MVAGERKAKGENRGERGGGEREGKRKGKRRKQLLRFYYVPDTALKT